MSEISSALSAFSKKFSRFTRANPSASPNLPPGAEEDIQRRIMERDEAFSAEVIRTYTKYRFPYKTLGENSVEAAAIKNDEDALMAAYNLFKAVLAANEEFGTEQTRIRDDVIASPLVHKTAYTQGDDFVFLQCWLMYEQKIGDYVPLFAQNKDGSYILHFEAASSYHADYKKKEILAVIQEEFYPVA